eukprot:5890673-Pyramimonas_sp.AAC.1
MRQRGCATGWRRICQGACDVASRSKLKFLQIGRNLCKWMYRATRAHGNGAGGSASQARDRRALEERGQGGGRTYLSGSGMTHRNLSHHACMLGHERN